MHTAVRFVGRPRVRLALALAALVCALTTLAAGAQIARAGTWYIHPTMYNNTQSTDQSQCGSHTNWAGCMILDGSGINDGYFTEDPYGNTGGRPTLPATCATGVSDCADGAGPGNPSPPNIDQPQFDAPNFDEGADGYYEYTMPDGNHYSLVAEDDENGLGDFAAAYPGCGANPGEHDTYVCVATFQRGANGYPASSPFSPIFGFYPQGDAAPYIAAGQICSEGSGTFECTVGRSCQGYSGSQFYPVLECTNVPGGGEWSPVDPSNYMFLTFYDSSSSGPVTITDLGVESGFTGGSPASCTIQESGHVCTIYTSGGCALGDNVTNACGSDAIQINDGSGTNATVEVLDEAELPDVLAQHWKAGAIAEVGAAINQAFSNWPPVPPTASPLAGPRPALRALRVSAGARERRLAVSYHDSAPATTVLTLARALPGLRHHGRCVAGDGEHDTAAGECTRWAPLPGRLVRYSTDMYWVPRRSSSCRAGGACGRSGCHAPAARSRGRCHLRLRLYGHARHRDTVGRNTLRLPLRLAGRRGLTPGRYRLSAVAAIGARTSRSVSMVFKVRP